MIPRELKKVKKGDIVSRRPGQVDPLKPDVGEIIKRQPHWFAVKWDSKTLPIDTFFDNHDPQLADLTLHQHDFH